MDEYPVKRAGNGLVAARRGLRDTAENKDKMFSIVLDLDVVAGSIILRVPELEAWRNRDH